MLGSRHLVRGRGRLAVLGAIAVALVAVGLFAWANPIRGDDRLCVNVAQAAGLDFRGAYGTTVAPGADGRDDAAEHGSRGGRGRLRRRR